MPEEEQKRHAEFMVEKIKTVPINRRKLLRKTIMTATMAVIFGLIACVTFLVLEPIISKQLYPEEKPEIVEFPEDQEEMLPEEMLAENMPTEPPVEVEVTTEEGVVLEEDQIEEILANVILDKENYRELYDALGSYVTELKKYMVTVTAISSNMDWFSNVMQHMAHGTGVVLTDNSKEVLILADGNMLAKAEQILVTFYNGFQTEATVKQVDSYTNLAVLAIDFTNLPEKMQKENMEYPTLGSSGTKNLVGAPVVAMGSPMGVENSVGYGMITATDILYSVPDRNYKFLQTDISGSTNATGVLFNLDNEIIGIITNNNTDASVKNVIYAYGITELKKTLSKLSNAGEFSYLGISGMNISSEASSTYGVPIGAFITKVDMNSPAMLEGVQPGDVIVQVNGKNISTYNEYSSLILQTEPGENVKLTVKRQAQDGYKEMVFNIQTGEVKK